MDFQQLNQAQVAAVTAPLAPTLVLAGAGSGKTRVLTNRILYLVKECGVMPNEILAITFTNKAANEMKRRLLDFDCNAQYMQISTIHSFCAKILRYEAQQLNRSSNFSIYTEEEKKSVVKKIVKAVLDDSDAKSIDVFCDSISAIKNNEPHLMESDLLEAMKTNEYLAKEMEKLSGATQTATDEQLVSIINEYEQKMAECNALDFDDLLYYVHKIFANYPEILQKYRERYKFVLIDEFQDTNKVQYNIFKMLAEEHRNIFVVGDDDQSIYSWRGADSKNLKKFEKDFPDCNIYKLEQNYRSTKRILDVANKIIEQNPDRFEKVLWTENEDGVKTQLYTAYNEQDEAYYVVEQIKNLRYLNPKCKLKDFAILMRINALSRSFEAELQRNRFPYKVFGGFKFFERKEIKDILAYMRVIHNSRDNEAFIRALNVPRKRGIGDTTISKLSMASSMLGISILDVVGDEENMKGINSPTRKKLLDFHKLISDLRILSSKLSLKQFVHSMIDILDFRKFYQETGEDDRAINIDQFEESVNEFQHAFPHARLGDYLESVTLSNDIDEENNSDYVTIATIHAVKGLEFKYVFVVGLEDGIFPTSRSSYEVDTIREERRLMYVACTRAEKRLYLTRTRTRFMWGQRQPKFASKFYVEVEKFLTPARSPASERDMENDHYLDKLNNTDPVVTAPNQGKSKAQMAQIVAGIRVRHSSFGEGIVLNVAKDIAEVLFDSVGRKNLSIKFAPLEVISATNSATKPTASVATQSQNTTQPTLGRKTTATKPSLGNSATPKQTTKPTATFTTIEGKVGVGKMVWHATYGRGIILSIKDDIANTFFDKAGVKNIDLVNDTLKLVK